jgi:hypothetical protein
MNASIDRCDAVFRKELTNRFVGNSLCGTALSTPIGVKPMILSNQSSIAKKRTYHDYQLS